MTRRRIAFVNVDGTLYISQEFNGDKAEATDFKLYTNIQCDWWEVEELFLQLYGSEYTLKNFRHIIRKVEDMYGYEHVPMKARVTTPTVEQLFVVTREGCLKLIEKNNKAVIKPTVVFNVLSARPVETHDDIIFYKIIAACKTYKQLQSVLKQVKQENTNIQVQVNRLTL